MTFASGSQAILQDRSLKVSAIKVYWQLSFPHISTGAPLSSVASHTHSEPDKCGMMESTSSTISVSNPYRRSSKRLLFDRCYGWILDEWKDPSMEALEGGRGMFCILPLARALVQKASQLAAFDYGLCNFVSSLKNAGCKYNILGKNSHPDASNHPSQSQVESNE